MHILQNLVGVVVIAKQPIVCPNIHTNQTIISKWGESHHGMSNKKVMDIDHN
jgi:hypothetical protein